MLSCHIFNVMACREASDETGSTIESARQHVGGRYKKVRCKGGETPNQFDKIWKTLGLENYLVACFLAIKRMSPREIPKSLRSRSDNWESSRIVFLTRAQRRIWLEIRLNVFILVSSGTCLKHSRKTLSVYVALHIIDDICFTKGCTR